MAARNSSVPTDVDASSGVKTKCERGEMRIRDALDGEMVRARAYPAQPDPRMTMRSFFEPVTQYQ